MDKLDETTTRNTRVGIFREFWQFLAQSKKWWLLPVVIILVLFGFLMILSGTAAAPFIYTLF
jgi:hypothetical protein